MGSRDPLLELRDPIISRERLKLETSNLARRRGHVGSCDLVLEFWESPDISVTVEARSIKFGMDTVAVSSKEKMQN